MKTTVDNLNVLTFGEMINDVLSLIRDIGAAMLVVFLSMFLLFCTLWLARSILTAVTVTREQMRKKASVNRFDSAHGIVSMRSLQGDVSDD